MRRFLLRIFSCIFLEPRADYVSPSSLTNAHLEHDREDNEQRRSWSHAKYLHRDHKTQQLLLVRPAAKAATEKNARSRG